MRADACLYVGTIDLSAALGVGALGLLGMGMVGFALGWWAKQR